MTHYLKNGNTFRLANPENLNLHPQLPPATYVVRWDSVRNEYFLEIIEDFQLPGKLYGRLEAQSQRILQTFQDRSQGTGVLLVGEKGSGKTLLAKKLSRACAQQNIATILVNEPFQGDEFNTFLQSIETPALILFDEFEKVYHREEDQNQVLTLLDGVYPSKKLWLLTCNDPWGVNRYMRNRPGRIFYLLKFGSLEPEFIRQYCEENLQNQQEIPGLMLAVQQFTEFNFDMLKALVEEMNRYSESALDALALLNIKAEFSADQEYQVELLLPDPGTGGLSKPHHVENRSWEGNPFTKAAHVDYRITEDSGWDRARFEPRDICQVEMRQIRLKNSLGQELCLSQQPPLKNKFLTL